MRDFQPDFFSVNSDEPKSGGDISNLQIMEVIHSQFPSIGEVKRTIELGGVGINSRNLAIKEFDIKILGKKFVKCFEDFK